MELLHNTGVLDRRFVAVHATQLLPHEIEQLGTAGAWAEDAVFLDEDGAAIAGAGAELLADAVILGATPRPEDRAERPSPTL